jgi:hypothetical protein
MRPRLLALPLSVTRLPNCIVLMVMMVTDFPSQHTTTPVTLDWGMTTQQNRDATQQNCDPTYVTHNKSVMLELLLYYLYYTTAAAALNCTLTLHSRQCYCTVQLLYNSVATLR